MHEIFRVESPQGLTGRLAFANQRLKIHRGKQTFFLESRCRQAGLQLGHFAAEATRVGHLSAPGDSGPASSLKAITDPRHASFERDDRRGGWVGAVGPLDGRPQVLHHAKDMAAIEASGELVKTATAASCLQRGKLVKLVEAKGHHCHIRRLVESAGPFLQRRPDMLTASVIFDHKVVVGVLARQGNARSASTDHAPEPTVADRPHHEPTDALHVGIDHAPAGE